MSYEQQREEAMRLLKRHAAQLAEHFETVQIFVTKRGEDGTASAVDGVGNWFARYGQVRHWIEHENRHTGLDGPGEDED